MKIKDIIDELKKYDENKDIYFTLSFKDFNDCPITHNVRNFKIHDISEKYAVFMIDGGKYIKI